MNDSKMSSNAYKMVLNDCKMSSNVIKTSLNACKMLLIGCKMLLNAFKMLSNACQNENVLKKREQPLRIIPFVFYESRSPVSLLRSFLLFAVFNIRLSSRQTCNWHTVWRATYVIHTHFVAEFNRTWFAAMFAANSYF